MLETGSPESSDSFQCVFDESSVEIESLLLSEGRREPSFDSTQVGRTGEDHEALAVSGQAQRMLNLLKWGSTTAWPRLNPTPREPRGGFLQIEPGGRGAPGFPRRRGVPARRLDVPTRARQRPGRPARP